MRINPQKVKTHPKNNYFNNEEVQKQCDGLPMLLP